MRLDIFPTRKYGLIIHILSADWRFAIFCGTPRLFDIFWSRVSGLRIYRGAMRADID